MLLRIEFALNEGSLDEKGTNTFEIVRLLRELADELEKESERDPGVELPAGWRRELRDELGFQIGAAFVCGEDEAVDDEEKSE